MLFHLSTQTGIYFVTRPEKLEPHSGNKMNEYGEGSDSLLNITVLEARLHIPTRSGLERSVYALLPVASEAVTKDAEFLGQVWVRIRFYLLCTQ